MTHSPKLLEVHVTVLPKGDKDPSLVTTYRPISLLNIDIKCYAKALANPLLSIFSDIVSLDQVGFVPGREARENTLKVLFLHHWLTKTDTRGFFLSMDVEKAFDRVARDYMFGILGHLGLGDKFR